jgi:hypothetical protein
MGSPSFKYLIVSAEGVARAVEDLKTSGIHCEAIRPSNCDEAIFCQSASHRLTVSVDHDLKEPGTDFVLIPYAPYSWKPWKWRGDRELFTQVRAAFVYWGIRSSWEMRARNADCSSISRNDESLGRELALQQLELAVQEIEQYERRRYYNDDFAKQVMIAAVWLSADHLADRSLRIWSRLAREWRPTQGRSGERSHYGRKWLESQRENFDRRHPVYSESEILEPIRQEAASNPSLALALDRRYDEAFAISQSDRGLEEIADIQALLGDFDDALQTVRSRVAEPRRTGLLVVIALETFRRGQVNRTYAILEELEARNVQMWDRLHLALGFAGRMPWNSYPLPDY